MFDLCLCLRFGLRLIFMRVVYCMIDHDFPAKSQAVQWAYPWNRVAFDFHEDYLLYVWSGLFGEKPGGAMGISMDQGCV